MASGHYFKIAFQINIFYYFSGELGAGTAVGEILDMLDLFSDESDDEW